jgi:hypothetical protein
MQHTRSMIQRRRAERAICGARRWKIAAVLAV